MSTMDCCLTFRVMFCNSNACNAKRIPWSPPVKVEVRPKGGESNFDQGGFFDSANPK